MHCSIWAAIWAAISCGRTTAMPLEKEYLGMAYDWDRQWPDESMRICQNFWKQTNYISKRSSNKTKHNKPTFLSYAESCSKLFCPQTKAILGKVDLVRCSWPYFGYCRGTWGTIPGDFSHLQTSPKQQLRWPLRLRVFFFNVSVWQSVKVWKRWNITVFLMKLLVWWLERHRNWKGVDGCKLTKPSVDNRAWTGPVDGCWWRKYATSMDVIGAAKVI